MLINCPKCGLSQPDDQYCAQCGVNMHSFKKKEKPPIIKLLTSATFQIFILLLIGLLVGQSLFKNQDSRSWFKQITHFQGFTKSKSTAHFDSNPNSDNFETHLSNAASQNNSAESDAENKIASSALAATSMPMGTTSDAQNLSSVVFKVKYVEINADILAKWMSESTQLGFFQNLDNYSAGILPDFKKRKNPAFQIIKTFDIKLSAGASASNLSGILSPDGNQFTGLLTLLEFKTLEDDILHGNVYVTKSGLQGTESYPAEFVLPKESIFFIVGALKPHHFASERSKLDMPPFQIFKSADFMTRKTEFVIIIEPDYK